MTTCFLFSLLLICVGTASAADITVNNSTGPIADYTSIQAAVDAAANGDTIIVYPGAYTENVDVNKELTIESDSGNPDDTVVRVADPSEHIFYVTANNVIISGFTVTGAISNRKAGIYLYGIEGCVVNNNIVTDNSYGIDLLYSNDNMLKDNNALNNTFSGIGMSGSSGNTLTSNTVSDNQVGIFIGDSKGNTLTGNIASNNSYDGIFLASASNNTLSNNNIWGNIECGILQSYSTKNTLNNNNIWSNVIGISLIGSSGNTLAGNIASNNSYSGIDLADYSEGNTLTGNIVSNNQVGIDISDSNDNTLTSNTASKNKDYGISLCSSGNNLIYNNYFNNTRKAYDDGNNIWNITKTSGTNIAGGPFLGGNYWSDYEGIDTDGDGLGDTLLPYNCEGQIASGGDYLPLVAYAKYNPYDSNQDCEIDMDELSAAIDDFYAGTLDIEGLSEIIDYYYLGGAGYC